MLSFFFLFFFFFNDTATTEIYTLSLHDALPIPVPTAISARRRTNSAVVSPPACTPRRTPVARATSPAATTWPRSEERRLASRGASTRKPAVDRRPTVRSMANTATTTAYGSSQPRDGPGTASLDGREEVDGCVTPTPSLWSTGATAFGSIAVRLRSARAAAFGSTRCGPPAHCKLRSGYPARPATRAQDRHPGEVRCRRCRGSQPRVPRLPMGSHQRGYDDGASPTAGQRPGGCAGTSPLRARAKGLGACAPS